MSQPAARMGDSTAHGGVIAQGFPMVLIGGQPAARQGDMHVCPMVNPGVPPPPHVGGPIAMGSPVVLIGGQPAARQGDMAVCAGPPDVIAMGCPTVLIGTGPGSGGGAPGMGAGGGAQGSSAVANTDSAEAVEKLDVLIETTGEGDPVAWGAAFDEALLNGRSAQARSKESTTRNEHWIEFEFVDTAGLPVSGVPYRFTDTEAKESDGLLATNGMIARDGIPAGTARVVLMTIYNARWSATMAKVGETVQMKADVDGFAPGTRAVFQVYKRDVQGAPTLAASVPAVTAATTVEAAWTCAPPLPEEDVVVPDEGATDADVEVQGYSAPDYYFEVVVEVCVARSDLLYVEDFIEVEALDEDDHPLQEEPYVLFVCNGEVREGALDGSGQAREEKIPAGMCNLRLPELPDTEYQE